MQFIFGIVKAMMIYVNVGYIVLFAFTLLLLWKFYKWRRFVPVVNKFPMLRLKFYHFFGHSEFPLYSRRTGLPFSPHVYDFLVVNGYCSLFNKEGFAVVWAFYSPIMFVFKAKSAEVLLTHNSELGKSLVYKFMHPWLGTGLLTSDGAKWRYRRKLLTPAFHFNILKDFLAVFNKQSRILVEMLKSHTSDDFIDIMPFITRCSLDIICESILGAELHVQKNPESQYLKAVSFLSATVAERFFNPFIWPDLLFKISAIGKQFFKHLDHVHDFTNELIQKKKEKLKEIPKDMYNREKNNNTFKRKALMDLLLDEHVYNNSLSEADIREEIDTFTFEGHDTTSSAIHWSLYLIGLNPDVQEKMHEELDLLFNGDERDATVEDLKNMKYLECVLKESLRLYPPVPIFGRRLKHDFEFQGKTFPRGTDIMIFTYFLHRDSDVFPNPEKFCPERFLPENCVGRHPFAYLPFSAGPRNCIGQRFALMEEKVIISSILRKFTIRSLDPRDKVQPVMDMVLRPSDSLRIEIRLRNDNTAI